jgi:hypothetical protein
MNSDIIFTKNEIKGELSTRTIIRKQNLTALRNRVNIPTWKVVLILLTFLLLATLLIAALVIVTNAKRPANYQESCDKRSCNKDLDMVCIDGTCQCTADQYFTNKCQNKRSNMDFCLNDEQCKDYLDNFNLINKLVLLVNSKEYQAK